MGIYALTLKAGGKILLALNPYLEHGFSLLVYKALVENIPVKDKTSESFVVISFHRQKSLWNPCQ